MTDNTTITVGEPYDGDTIYAPNLREQFRVTDVSQDEQGRPILAVDVWDEVTGVYVRHSTLPAYEDERA